MRDGRFDGRAPLLVAIAIGAALATPLLAADAAGGASPAETLKTEVRYLEAGKFSQFYALLSPRFQASCPFTKFRKTAPAERQQLGTASVHLLRVRIVKDRAYLDYAFERDGKRLAAIHGDVYVRLHRSWFDEIDKYTSC